MKDIPENWYVEEVTESIGNVVVASKIRDCTERDVAKARRLHKAGKCPHTIVYATDCWPYSAITCAICGQHRGLA